MFRKFPELIKRRFALSNQSTHTTQMRNMLEVKKVEKLNNPQLDAQPIYEITDTDGKKLQEAKKKFDMLGFFTKLVPDKKGKQSLLVTKNLDKTVETACKEINEGEKGSKFKK